MNHMGTRHIETERLILRVFTLDDAPAMYQNWANDPDVTRFLTWPPHGNNRITKDLLDEWIAHYTESDYYQWGIASKENGEVIGSIAVVRLNESIDEAELGYCCGKAWWGQGIMTEACRAVIRYLFEEVSCKRISACHDINNPASGRVMQKSGMQYEGVLRRAGRNNQGIVDIAVYSILQEEFRAQNDQ